MENPNKNPGPLVFPLNKLEQEIQRNINQGAGLFPPSEDGVTTLILMNSADIGTHDLWWVDSKKATKGYNVYRAYDYPVNWVKINPYLWPGHFYRDQTTLQKVTYTLQDADWLEHGEQGHWIFKIPDVPFAELVRGRPLLANSGDDVTVLLDGVPFRPVQVSGADQTVWLQMDNTLPEGGYVTAFPLASNGVAYEADYSAVKVFQVVYNKLVNNVDIYTNLVRTFYTIVPVGDNGELHLPGAPGTETVNTMEVEKRDYMLKEMIRRNKFLFELRGEPTYILFRKTRGIICGCKRQGLYQARSACPICFETGIVGGYYGPYDFTYVDPDTATTREINEGGIKVTRTSRSYLGPSPIIQDGDLIVRRNGERLVVHGVTYKQPQGALVQQEFDTTLLAAGDTRYLIPVLKGQLPVIYNPVVTKDPVDGGVGNGEPLADSRTQPRPPEDTRDAKTPQVGRTITFGKIQT